MNIVTLKTAQMLVLSYIMFKIFINDSEKETFGLSF